MNVINSDSKVIIIANNNNNNNNDDDDDDRFPKFLFLSLKR